MHLMTPVISALPLRHGSPFHGNDRRGLPPHLAASCPEIRPAPAFAWLVSISMPLS